MGFVDGCETCGLLFVNPPPTADELAETYGPDGGWGDARGTRAEHAGESIVGRPGAGSWRHMFDGIRTELDVTRPPAGSRVLDYGCGSGKFLDVLQDCGWSTFGIETAGAEAFKRHQRLEAIPGEGTFDLILFHHVLEHLTRPLDVLQEAAAAVRPGGYLLVSVPRFDTLAEHRDHKYMINRSHVTAYTRTCLEGLFARAGWRPLEGPVDGGRRGEKRLRLLASRTDDVLPLPTRPLDAARRSLAAFHATGPSRPLLERAGLIRLSAGVTEARRLVRHTGKRVATRAMGVRRLH
ncbi:MAG: class I SAM-dependent methyltransferase [Vicinamibacterales bacterium]